MLSFRQKTPKQTLLFLFSSSKYKTNSSDKNALFEKRERREEERCRRERQMRVYLKCFCGVLLLFCLPVLRLIEERISISVSDFELAEKRAKSKKRGRVLPPKRAHFFLSHILRAFIILSRSAFTYNCFLLYSRKSRAETSFTTQQKRF